MSRCALFDDHARRAFLPFTYSRPLSEIRFGIFTLREKWERIMGWDVESLTVPYLRGKFPFSGASVECWINARSLPDQGLSERISALKEGEALFKGDALIALCPKRRERETLLKVYDEEGMDGILEHFVDEQITYEGEVDILEQKWELFSRNGEAIRSDYDALKDKVGAAEVPSSNALIGDQVFIEEGAEVRHATLNSEEGPIYISKGAEVMEGAMIRGPFYLAPHAVVKMGAKIYGPTTIGPYGKVGGELNNCVFFGYSNKAHDGFLGNSVIGEWCNLGADTNNSNLKNNYGSVKVWDPMNEGLADTGLTFCGLFMGDHSKCGIDTMFNTGTTIGFSANIFDAGFPPKFVPSFFWGGSGGGETYELEKAKEVGKRMRDRRGLPFDAEEERIFDTVYQITEREREGVV